VDTGARLILTLDQLHDVVEEVRADTGIEHVVVTSLGEMAPAEPLFPAPPAVLAAKRPVTAAIDLLPALETIAKPFT
ncbi:hypothetical protein, partial [Klebsiella michiganensis]|uniref:hypothetical protein n=1 Tax=Klebsiella michiganensis TaxID=1134687 RepID=UPI001953DC73